jgi:predicted lipoprotein with Yx(FWY)xxD motif
MTRLLFLLGLATAIATVAAATLLTATGRAASGGTMISLRKTPLGTVLVDGRGHTLYLFEKDHNGLSTCTTACAQYWPALTSHGTPRAGSGVQQSLLRIGRADQVLYASHPLYTFAGDKHAGQTSGEGLTNFGAGWYALAANGRKVEPTKSSSGSAGSSGYSYSGGY